MEKKYVVELLIKNGSPSGLNDWTVLHLMTEEELANAIKTEKRGAWEIPNVWLLGEKVKA